MRYVVVRWFIKWRTQISYTEFVSHRLFSPSHRVKAASVDISKDETNKEPLLSYGFSTLPIDYAMFYLSQYILDYLYNGLHDLATDKTKKYLTDRIY